MLLNLKKYLKNNLGLICVFLSIIILFIGCEITHPYYFLQDDNADWYVCSFEHTVRSAFSGEIALYNFHQFSGIPHLDKGQSGVLNPMVYLAWIISHVLFGHSCASIDILAFIFSMTGGIAMYYLLKRMRLNDIASAVGGISWAFNAFLIVIGANWIIVIMTAGCFPLMILADLYLLDKYSVKRIIISSLPKLFCFYCGHPQFFLYAVVFEVVFVLSFIAFSDCDHGSTMEDKRKRVISLTGKFMTGYIPLAIWSLPLLVPMFLAMRNSADRGGNLDFDTFFSLSSDLKLWLFSLIYPFSMINQGRDLSHGISGDESLIRMQVVTGHIGYILLASLPAALYLCIRSNKKSGENCISGSQKDGGRDGCKATCIERKCCLIMIPGLLISSLWTFSMLFNRLVYLVPVVNRFRWPFKILMFVNFFMIAVASAGLSYIMKKLEKRIKGMAMHLVYGLVLLAVIVNFAFLYFAFPVRTIVFENAGTKPYSDPFCSIIGNERFISEAGWNIVADPGTGRIIGDAPSGLDGNFATYYGLNSRSGYDQLVTTESAEYRAILEDKTDNTGMISSLDETDIARLRIQGVSYYVSNSDHEAFYDSLGMEKAAEDRGRVLFHDSEAMPLAYMISENGEYKGPVSDFTQNVNYLEVNTDEMFENGYIVFNYVKQRNFHGYIDGVEVPIERGVYVGSMVISCPAGKHNVRIVYEDHAFELATITSIVITLLFILAFRFRKVKRNDFK